MISPQPHMPAPQGKRAAQWRPDGSQAHRGPQDRRCHILWHLWQDAMPWSKMWSG